jgi:hypothetical protein
MKNYPKPPLNRIIKEGNANFCIICGSTTSKDGFLGLFGNLICHNKECKNSRKSTSKHL